MGDGHGHGGTRPERRSSDKSVGGSKSVLTNTNNLNRVRTLRRTRSAVALQPDSKGHSQDSHDHHKKPPSLLTAAISAAVNWMLMFGLCSAYGIIMFDDHWNERHRGLGVKMNLCSALIVGLLLAGSSKIGGAIGGPDLNPVVFLGVFVHRIAESIATQRGLGIPRADERRLLESGEALLTSGGAILSTWDLRQLFGRNDGQTEFCTGSHYALYPDNCDGYHNELRATAIFSVSISSLFMGLLFFGLGHFKMTRLVSYVPTTIMEAFLSCVGYKVFVYALKICLLDPPQVVVAGCVGVPLYFLKHAGNPAVVIPAILLVPLAVFYSVVYGMGGNLQSAREAGWMFDILDNVVFYSVWRDGPASSTHINFTAWMTTLADLLVMITMCLLDCMLKMSSIESTLPEQLDKDYETQLYGIGNFITTLCGSSVGYMQPELNHVNFGIMGNTVDRRAGIMYSLLCGLVLFWTTDLFNYVPRFFLSTLLIFQGTGFVVENFWGSRKYLSSFEWAEIFVILAVFIISESLLYAVVVGGLLTAATFIYHYAKIPCVAGRPRAGGEGRTLQRHSFLLQKKVQHIANSWLLVIHLKGYIFFGSAEKLVGEVIRQLEWQRQNVPVYQRLHWLIFDCEQLDGLDSSASKTFGKLAAVAQGMNLEIIWSHAAPALVKGLKACGTILDEKQVSPDLSDAKNSVENTIQAYINGQQAKWLELHPLFQLFYEVTRERMSLEPFEEILQHDMARFGVPWEYCSRMRTRAFSTLLWKKGERRKTLFLVHSGKVGLFLDIPDDMATGEWGMPLRVYGRGRLLDRVAFCKVPAFLHAVAIEDGELLCWNEVQWAAMAREQPCMAASITQALLRQDEDEEEERGMDFILNRGGMEVDKEDSVESMDSGVGLVEILTSNRAPAGPALINRKRALKDDLQHYLRPLQITKGLAELGLFNPPGSNATPRFTPGFLEHIEKDLNVAYDTYKEVEAGSSLLPEDKVAEALLYAGVHGLGLLKESIGSLSESEFMTLGRDLTMAAFSKKQTEGILRLFKNHSHRGSMSRTEVVRILRAKVHSEMSVEEIENLINFCGGPRVRSVDEDTFIAIMARLVRKYEREWCVLVAIRKLIKATETDDMADRLTPEMLVNNPVGRQMSEIEAEELLWSSNFCSSDMDANLGLNIQMVLPALWPCEAPAIDLPPIARRKHLNSRNSSPSRSPPPPPAPPSPTPFSANSPSSPSKPVALLTTRDKDKYPQFTSEKAQLVASLFGDPTYPANGSNGHTHPSKVTFEGSSNRASSSPPTTTFCGSGLESLDLKAQGNRAYGDGMIVEDVAPRPLRQPDFAMTPPPKDVSRCFSPPDRRTSPGRRHPEGLKWGTVEHIPPRGSWTWNEDILPNKTRRQLVDIRSLGLMVDKFPETPEGCTLKRLHFSRHPRWEKSDTWLLLEEEDSQRRTKVSRRQSIINTLTQSKLAEGGPPIVGRWARRPSVSVKS